MELNRLAPPPALQPDAIQLSLVLPCYREVEHIDVSVPRILRVLADLPFASEIIFVDDASPDDTVAHLERLRLAYAPWPMRLLRHATNQGRGAAVTTGFRAARGRWVGFIDVDLEVPPDYIAVCCRILDEGWDVCIGSRYYPATLGALPRFLASTIYRKLAWRVLGLPQIDSESGYKFFVRERVLPLLDRTVSRHWFWDTEIVVESYLAGLRVAHTPCLHLRRTDKTSTVRLVRDSLYFVRELWRLRRDLARRGEPRRAVPPPALVRPIAHRNLVTRASTTGWQVADDGHPTRGAGAGTAGGLSVERATDGNGRAVSPRAPRTDTDVDQVDAAGRPLR